MNEQQSSRLWDRVLDTAQQVREAEAALRRAESWPERQRAREQATWARWDQQDAQDAWEQETPR